MAKKKGLLATLFGGASKSRSKSRVKSKSRSTVSKARAPKSKTSTKKPSAKPTAKKGSKKPLRSASSKTKNVSRKIPNGRTLQTRDEYFEGKKNYRKPGYEQKGNYRKVVVVDSNRKDDLAVVKLTTSGKGKSILGEKKSKYRPYVETKDDTGKPIRIGKKFIQNSPQKDLSPQAVSQIREDVFQNSYYALSNRKKIRQLKKEKREQKK